MRYLELGDVERAVAALSDSVKVNPHQCDAFYTLGFSYARLRDCSAARAVLAKARAVEPAWLERDLRLYNEAVRELAAETGSALVDVEQVVSGDEAETLFLDTIHLSPEGHALVGRALRDAIVQAGWLRAWGTQATRGPERRT